MHKSMIVALGATALAAFAATPASAQRWGFESGTLDGWSASGDAFATQPTFGNNVAVRRPGESPGNDGNYWLGTFENHRFAGSPPGITQGDGPQGTLTSPAFVIDGQSVAFLVGGGRDIDHEYVALLVKWEPGMPPPARPDVVTHLPDGDYLTFQKATGRDDEHMMRTIWPVDRWIGRTARFQVVDRASGPWGHINADSFQLSWEPPLGRAVLVPAAPLGTAVPVTTGPLGTAVPVPPGSPPIAYPGGGGHVVVQPPAPGQPPTAYAVGGGPVTVMPPAPGAMARATDPGGPMMAGSGPPPAPPIRYRLVASSFFVDHQTADDMLERDGRGDEIFVRGDWYAYRGGAFAAHGSVKSAVFGDRREIQAGSARPGINSADDQPGGLVTNDSYPVGRDGFDPTPSSRRGDLPLVLWEGTLRPGDAVLVVPSMWEWDGAETSRAEVDWNHWLSAQAPQLRLGGRALADNGPPFPDGTPISAAILRPLDVYDMGTRPIGAQVWEHRRGAGMRVPAFVLTYDSAFRAAGQTMMFGARLRNPDGTVTSAEYAGPVGGFQMHFVDPPELEGEYTLSLRLERVR